MSYLDWDATANRQQRRRRYNLLDGVDSQAGSSKPTTRSDGTALQTGDRWLDTGDRIWFYWNGTYWLSEQIFSFDAIFTTTISASAFPGGFKPMAGYNLFYRVLSFNGSFLSGTYDATNNWTIRLVREPEAGSTGSGVADATLNTLQSTIAATTAYTYTSTLNLHRDVSALSIARVRIDAIRNGTAPSVNASAARITYQLAKP